MKAPLAVIAALVLAACAGPRGSSSSSRIAPSSPVGVLTGALYPMRSVGRSARDDAQVLAPLGSVTIEATDSTHFIGAAYDLNNALIANVTATEEQGIIRYQASVGGKNIEFASLAPSSIVDGNNPLPGGGNLNVDAATGVVTADVLNGGVRWHIVATPAPENAYTMTVTSSTGQVWTQLIAFGQTPSLAINSLRIGADANNKGCAISTGVAEGAGGVAGIAAGIAVLAPITAPVAGPISGVSGIVAGIGLLGMLFMCPL